ncbi:MAG: hypothetical protein C4539_10055 [Ignavibacteriales bacterium]|nr:MAG: hypothetical protein C4539_10055 [Ignavibacteriales bacterium]
MKQKKYLTMVMNYLSDTKPEAEKILISLLQKSNLANKILQVCSLTNMTINLSKRAISRANPDLCKRELDILFVKYHYGKILAEKLSNYLI